MHIPPQDFLAPLSEKFENGVHTVGYYFYYRFYLKKLIHLAVRVWAYGNMPKKNITARSAPLIAHQCTPQGNLHPFCQMSIDPPLTYTEYPTSSNQYLPTETSL